MYETVSLLHTLFPVLIILFSIIIHEFAHGYVAYLLGDNTAYAAGRLTLNPIPHIDLVGSIIVPIISFATAGTFLGWAKPVPVNLRNVEGRYGDVLVSSAGVLTNLFLATVCGVIYKVLSFQGILTEGLSVPLFTVIAVNVSLAFFNLIPVPPFDGMSIIQGFFPKLHSLSRLAYNPLYLICAIFIASSIYSIFIPHVFTLVLQLIS